MIKAIIFDCFGVLTTTDTWGSFLDSLPADVDINAVRELNRANDAGLIDSETFLRQIREATGHTPVQVESLLKNEIAKNLLLLEYITQLRDEYKIGLLSNIATPWITDTFLTPEEQQLFDAMIFSYEVGMTKPDPRIFALTCKRLGVNPNQAVLVDDIERYCEAAKMEGMKAVVYRDFKQCKQDLEKILSSQ